MGMLKRSFKTLLVASAFGSAFLLASAIQTESLAQTKIKVGRTTTGSGFHIPTYIAMDKGFFKKEGLDAEFVSMSGKALVTAGLGGAIDFVPIPGGGSQAALRGADLRYVVGQSKISQWVIIADPKIMKVEDLKGKTIGYGRPGSSDYDEGEITLARFFKLNVGRDYKVISFRGEADRIAAMVNGDISAGLVSFAHAARANTLGFKTLLKTGTYLPRVGGCVWVRGEFLKKNPDTVKRFIRAMTKAMDYLRTNKQGSSEVIQAQFGTKTLKEAGFIWDEVHDQYSPELPPVLFKKLFQSRHKRLVKKKLWPAGKPLPDVEKFVARGLLHATLNDMGYKFEKK